MHSCLLFQTYVNKINDSEPKEKIGKILKPMSSKTNLFNKSQPNNKKKQKKNNLKKASLVTQEICVLLHNFLCKLGFLSCVSFYARNRVKINNFLLNLHDKFFRVNAID